MAVAWAAGRWQGLKPGIVLSEFGSDFVDSTPY